MTRPRAVGTPVALLAVAAGGGLAAGLAPDAALVGMAALGSALLLVPRVERAALAVIASAVFEDYLDVVSPWATEWLVAVLFAAWSLRRARGPLHGHRIRGPVVSSAVLVAAVALAYAAHPHGSPGLEAAARYAALAALMLVLADCLCGPLTPRRAARTYVLSCVLASVCALVHALLTEDHQVAGPLESPGTLAFFLVAAVPLVATVRNRPDQPVWWVWACFVVLLAAGVGTQSQSGLVALLGMVLVALLTGLLAPRHAGVVLALLATGVALVVALRPLPAGEVLTDAQRQADRTLHQQGDLRRAALEMVRESPVLGLGPGAFPLLHRDHRAADAPDTPDDAEVQTSHSTALEVAAELGLVGLLSLYAAWLLPAVGALRRLRRHRSRLTATTLLALAGLLTASLVASQQYALPLWLMAAMATALGRAAPRRAPIFPDPGQERTSGQLAPR